MGADNVGATDNLTLADLLAAPLLAACQGNRQMALACLDYVQQVWLQSAGSGSGPQPVRRVEMNLGCLPGAEPGQAFAVRAAVAALLPLPQLALQSMELDFSVAVREQGPADDTGLPVLRGRLAASERHARPSDQTGRYAVRIHATQMPQAEGMAKLMRLLAATLEPTPITADPDHGSAP